MQGATIIPGTLKPILARIILNPADAGQWSALGLGLVENDDLALAASPLRRCVILVPDEPTALNNLGNVLDELGETDGALIHFATALVLSPGSVEFYVNLVSALIHWGERAPGTDQQIVIATWAAFLAPERADVLYAQGAALQNRCFDLEAASIYRRSLMKEPTNARTWYNLGLSLLRAGQYGPGFEAFEWRHKVEPPITNRRQFDVPRWNGRALPADAHLLLHAEQGNGDTLQFLRFVPQIPRGQGQLILLVQQGLGTLARELAQVDQVIEDGEAQPDIDVHLPLLSLPRVLQIKSGEGLSSAPYLRAPQAAREKWSQALSAGDRLRVGLAFSGNPNHKRDRLRSLSAHDADALIRANPDIEFHLLSNQDLPAYRELGWDKLMVRSYADRLPTWADTAALVEQLDVVISVDTAIAHLAGSLGKPVWILLARVADWRWGLSGDQTPWYPTARLYRQKAEGDWGQVLDQLRRDLTDRQVAVLR